MHEGRQDWTPCSMHEGRQDMTQRSKPEALQQLLEHYFTPPTLAYIGGRTIGGRIIWVAACATATRPGGGAAGAISSPHAISNYTALHSHLPKYKIGGSAKMRK